VLGLDDPIHFDAAAARAEGFRDLVAPPSFFMVVEAAAEDARNQRSQPTLFEAIAADFRYLLHGDERYTYVAPLCAGDRVTFSAVVGDFSDKKGGLIELVTVRSEISHPTFGVLVHGERTLLHRFG
jgi:acyl dehydratase